MATVPAQPDIVSVRKALEYQQARSKALLSAYRAAKRELDAIMRNAVATDFQRFRAAEQIKQIQAQIRALNAQCTSIARDLVKSGYQQGVSVSKNVLARRGVDMTGLNMGNRLNFSAIEALADKYAADLIGANASLEKFATGIIRGTQQRVISEQAVTNAIMRGTIKGDTVRGISKALQSQLAEAMEDGAKIVINGRKYNPVKYADMVARTMTRSAQTKGTINNSLQFGISLFQVSFHSGSCDACLAYQGKVYSLGPNEYGFPELTNEPPYHPNCRHVLLPYVEVSSKEREAMVTLSNGEDITDADGYTKRLAMLEAA